MARMILKASTQPLFDMAGNWISDVVGGIISGGASGTKAATVPAGFNIFGGPRAEGGDVSPGRWYMVGEDGPEPFVPSVPGTIYPNGTQLGGSTTNIYADLRGATPEAVMRLERWVASIDGNLEQRAGAYVLDRKLRSSSYGKAMTR